MKQDSSEKVNAPPRWGIIPKMLSLEKFLYKDTIHWRNKFMKDKKYRVKAYVDGSNLYFGMIDAGFRNCKWLNVDKLIRSFLRSNQELVEIKYFTSRITHNPPKQKRQTTYLEALESTGVNLIYGSYQAKFTDCRKCGNSWIIPNEKMTDVNLATHLLMDAFQDQYDIAIVVSGDSDFVPCIQSVNEHFLDKSVIVFFPPLRRNESVVEVARAFQMIGRKKLVENQFPLHVRKKDGFVLERPDEWS